LKEFDGKNVTQYVSFACGAIEQLRSNEALPFDIMSIVANALKQCETEDFVAYILTMYNNHVQYVQRTTVNNMMTNAETEYVSLTLSTKWKAKLTNGDQSAFFTGDCYGCGNWGIDLISAQRQTQAVVGEDVVISVAEEDVDVDVDVAVLDVEEGMVHRSKRTRHLINQESRTPVPRMVGLKNGVVPTDIGLGAPWPMSPKTVPTQLPMLPLTATMTTLQIKMIQMLTPKWMNLETWLFM
jgi:hypothetical protein